MRSTALTWLTPLVLSLGLLLSACSSPESRVKDALDDWDATIIRYSWDCGALAMSMDRWLEMNGDELRTDVNALAADVSKLDHEERMTVLSSLTEGERSTQAHQALAKCGDNDDVMQQLAVMTDILLPVIMIESPPDPAPPVESDAE